MNDVSVKERIREILIQKESNPTKLSKAFSVNQKTLNNQINADVQISLSTILLILEAFEDVSAEWLLRGKGAMLLSPDKGLQPQQSENENNYLIDELKAELNQLKGENRILREMLNLKKSENSERSKTA